MATEAQINANRLNAQKSTGPRTEEGKRTVSQNAVKHGLFAHEAVIKCEDPAEFELHREALIDELKPVGAIESMLAERIVSLSWRLQRVERMQNEATDCLIEEDYLPLGRMATKRWSGNLKTIEKMFMHERRIESSLNRNITKLKKLQIIRRMERQDAEQQRAARAAAAFGLDNDFAKQTQLLNSIDSRGRDTLGTRRRDARDTSGTCEENFSKQSQFLQRLIDRASFLERHYDDIVRPDEDGNKPNFENPFLSELSKIARGEGFSTDEETS